MVWSKTETFYLIWRGLGEFDGAAGQFRAGIFNDVEAGVVDARMRLSLCAGDMLDESLRAGGRAEEGFGE